jgi:hypothetical protein
MWLAVISAFGLASSVAAFVASFFPSLELAVFRSWIILLPAWVALFLPIYAIEYPRSRRWTFAWDWAGSLPRWVRFCGNILGLIFIADFLWFAVHSGPGVPSIHEGQYVLEAGGHILRVLTRAEYLQLMAAGARLSAVATIGFYFAPAAYWYFNRKREWPETN